jgi:hypothetical protein
VMEIGSIIDVLRSSPEATALKTGDLFKIKVLEVFESQRILVDLGRWRTVADIRFPVAAGDEFWVRVQEASGQLRLQRVPPPDATLSAAAPAAGPVQGVSVESLKQVQIGLDELADALSRLPDSRQVSHEARQALEALRSFLHPFDLESTPVALAAKLKEFCENSGLFLETRLGAAVEKTADRPGVETVLDAASSAAAARVLAGDLKARLLLLRAFLEGSSAGAFVADRGAAAHLSRAVTELLADIRAGQEQMANTLSADPPIQLVHFALPMTDDRNPVRLKIAYRRRPAGEKQQGHRAAVLLALDRVGSIRADLFLLGQSLSISIFVSSTELQNVFARHAPDVRDALAEWFDTVSVQVKTSPGNIERFIVEDWRPAGESLVDVHA